MDTPPDIFRRRRDGEPNLIQRILRRGRESEDDATTMAATAADESPTAMPSQADVPAMSAKPGNTMNAILGDARFNPTGAPRDVLELEGKPVSTSDEIDMPSTPDEVEFDETQPQTWRGGGNYYYKYTPASGNKPATIQMHGGRYNRENPVTISQTGPAAGAFEEIMAEGRRMSAAGQAGQYITPQQYAKQRRDEGAASPMNDNERVKQVVGQLAEEGRVPGRQIDVGSMTTDQLYDKAAELRAAGGAEDTIRLISNEINSRFAQEQAAPTTQIDVGSMTTDQLYDKAAELRAAGGAEDTIRLISNEINSRFAQEQGTPAPMRGVEAGSSAAQAMGSGRSRQIPLGKPPRTRTTKPSAAQAMSNQALMGSEPADLTQDMTPASPSSPNLALGVNEADVDIQAALPRLAEDPEVRQFAGGTRGVPITSVLEDLLNKATAALEGGRQTEAAAFMKEAARIEALRRG